MPRPKSAVVVPAPTIRHRGPGRPSGTLEQSVNEAIVNAAVHHIVAVRRKRGGEITHVKHIKWGWMKIQDYYLLDEFHKLLPLINEVLRAGWDIKSRLWQTGVSAEFLASGVTIPFGAIEFAFAGVLFVQHTLQVEANKEAAVTNAALTAAYNKELSYYNSIPWSYEDQNGKTVGFKQVNGVTVYPPVAPALLPTYPNANIYQILDVACLFLPWGELYYLWMGVTDLMGLMAGLTSPGDLITTTESLTGINGIPADILNGIFTYIGDLFPGLKILLNL